MKVNSMSDNHDEKALQVLEKAVYHAQNSLEKTTHFQPFLMLLDNKGNIEVVKNGEADSTQSYALLEDELKKRIKKGDVDVMVLAADTLIPEQFVRNATNGIRLHLEEKSQIGKKISARFLYVPYELCRVGDGKLFVRLHDPVAVGFPAEYIIK